MKDITESTVDRYVAFVEKMISEYRKIGDLIDDHNEVTPARVNTALSMYYNISLALIAEYQRQKIKFETLNIEYKEWEDEKFQEAKENVINSYQERKIKPSVKEFETQMRTDNKVEYKRRTLELVEAESRMRFLLRLLNNLNRYDSILTTISYNARSEMRALSLDDRMNANPDRVSAHRIRSRVPINREEEDEE